MSTKLLTTLLGAQEHIFKLYIDNLERACMNPGVDIRLSAEIVTRVREKTRTLGCEPEDTTTQELFYLLKSRLESDDKVLKQALRLENAELDRTAKILAKVTQKLSVNELVLSLTSSGTKKILKAVPPRKTMRLLKYRSLESVIKRDEPKLLYAVACLVEDSSWRSQVHAKMKRLDAKDIAWQTIKCIDIPIKWFIKLTDFFVDKSIYLANTEAGVICIAPIIQSKKSGVTVLSLGLLLQAAQQMAIQSLPYRRQAFTQGYGVILPELAHGVEIELVSMHGLKPSWRAVYELVHTGHVEVQSPEVEFIVDEMQWQSIEIKLARIVPEFDFWVGSHFLGVDTSSQTVSFHFLDLAHAAVSGAEYGEQSTVHFEASLWNELQMRYLQQDVLNHSLMHQLNSSSTTDEDMVL